MFRFAGILVFLAACHPCIAKITFFQPVTSYPMTGAISVSLADLNGDGLLDLVVGTQANAVEVMLGNGDGTFQPATSYSVSDTVSSVAVADVNGDGKPDLVVATFGGFSLFLANGDGTFQPATEFSLPSFAGISAVAIADLNRDGKPDIVLSFVCDPGFNDCGHSGAVGVLLGDGKGGFGAAQISSSGGAYAIAVAVADMNRDGKLDVVVDNGQGNIAVLMGNGDGTLQDAAIYNSGGINDASLAIADFNGDGFPDVAIVLPCEGRGCHGYLGVLLNTGNGSLKKVKRYSTGGVAATGVAIADLNGDGNPDLLITNACDNLECDNSELGVLLGHGDGTFALSPHYYSGEDAGVNNAPSLAVGDINRDGNPDVVVINGGDGLGGFGVLLSLAKSSTALASSPNPSVQGQAVVLKATVTSLGSQAPAGKVIFKSDGKSIGSAVVTSGTASLTRKNLPVGNLSITAEYVGDAETQESTSPPLVQVVNTD